MLQKVRKTGVRVSAGSTLAMEYRVAMYMCMLKLKYLKYFKYAAKPTAGACMALAI